MDRNKVPLLTTARDVADFLGDPTNTWADKAAVHDKAAERLGIREAARLWRHGRQIADHRANRPGCAHGWCPVCAHGFTLIDNLRLPAHTWPNPHERYDRLCTGSGQAATKTLPVPWVEARKRWAEL